MKLIIQRWKHVALGRFPFKHIWDCLSLLKIFFYGIDLKQAPLQFGKRLDCINFYITANNIRRLYAAPPRSGSRWTQLGISLALDLANGGDGSYTFHNQWFYPRNGFICQRLDWRIPTGEWELIHNRPDGPTMDEQAFYLFHHPYFRLRCMPVKKMRIVVVTRSILASLESRYMKFASSNTHPEVTLENEDSFDWDESLTRAIEFFNSWGDVMTWHPNIRHYKYEDLKADTVGTHKEMLDFWGLDVSEDFIAEGFRMASKKEMQKRIEATNQTTSLHVSTRGSNHRNIISESRKKMILDRINQQIIYDFGYKFDDPSEYSIAYD